MKKEELFSAMSGIDESFIEEAKPKRKPSSRMRWIRIGTLAAMLAIVVCALGAWLLIPFSTDPTSAIREYRGSEYYPVIEKLNALSYRAPIYKNNLDKILSSFVIPDLKAEGGSLSGAAGGAAPDDSAEGNMSNTGKYEETTDNQVEGVIEADRIKRTSTHFFYLYGKEIFVYSIAGENSALVLNYTVSAPEGVAGISYWNREFYLTTDAKRLLLVQPYTHAQYGACYDIVSLDVSDPECIAEISRISMTGYYNSSRFTGNTLLLFGEYTIPGSCKYDQPETFLPLVNAGEGFVYPPMDNIVCPETVVGRFYTVINKINTETMQLCDTMAMLSASDVFFVSDNSIYLTQRTHESTALEGITSSGVLTEIVRISYEGEKLEKCGSVKLDGYLLNQYSLDEYEGKLRVVTTSDRTTYKSIGASGDTVGINYIDSGTSANLFIIDTATMQTVASVLRFAPRGETVRSVRFDGVYAYVCTAVQLTDPVFFFDLSDPDHITYKDTGTIEGFSTSLIQLGDGYLLGIGRSDTSSVKVEIYQQIETGVVSVAKYELPKAYYCSEYKTYLIDRERDYFGFGITYYNQVYMPNLYIVLHFDGGKLEELARVPIGGGNHADQRAVYVDGFLYFFCDFSFKVVKVDQGIGE